MTGPVSAIAYGDYPGYLSLMIKSFSRADEDAWLVGAPCDFARIGAPGLSSLVNYAVGRHAGVRIECLAGPG